MQNNFTELSLSFDIIKRLNFIDFKSPTPIQKEAIPSVLDGRDIFASAQTGTGKTGAFLIPILEKLIKDPHHSALILTPTRELATQILDFSKKIIKYHDKINPVLLIGGQSIDRQINFLFRSKPRLIVGTPGRINDHILRKTISLHRAKYIILDEADRMLDMGFSEQLKQILSCCPQDRQTLMFTATVPNNITSIASKYLKDPVKISIGSSLKPLESITRNNLFVESSEKFKVLGQELQKLDGSVIIFVNTKRSTENLASKLSKISYKVDYVHGDLRQSKRDRVIKNYLLNKFNILVATDVAARGLDIPQISTVINYDLPLSPEDFIHRIGRTGRAGASGVSLSLISPDQKYILESVEHFIKTGNKLKINKRKGRSFREKREFSNRSYSKNEKSDSRNDRPFSNIKKRKRSYKKVSSRKHEKSFQIV